MLNEVLGQLFSVRMVHLRLMVKLTVISKKKGLINLYKFLTVLK